MTDFCEILKSKTPDANIKKLSRRLEDAKSFFKNRSLAGKILAERNPVLYDVYEYIVPKENGHLSYAFTVLYPGKIGREYFMTKGHFHAQPDGAEIVMGIEGKGYFLLQDRRGLCVKHPVGKNDILYIKPGLAHRAVNNTRKKFTFLSICDAVIGHDYNTIEKYGFNRT